MVSELSVSVATLPAVKISKLGPVQPPKFGATALNKTLGAIIGRLSDDDVQAIAIRHAEIRAALRIRQEWLTQAKAVASSMAMNADTFKTISTVPDLASVRDEMLDYLHTDQLQVDKENLLARAQVLLCGRVIAALTDSLGDRPPTSTYLAGGARDRTPLRHLQDSAAAAGRAGQRLASIRGSDLGMIV